MNKTKIPHSVTSYGVPQGVVFRSNFIHLLHTFNTRNFYVFPNTVSECVRHQTKCTELLCWVRFESHMFLTVPGGERPSTVYKPWFGRPIQSSNRIQLIAMKTNQKVYIHTQVMRQEVKYKIWHISKSQSK